MTNTVYFKCVACLSITLALAGPVSFARDWPQWRGPNRDGITNSFTPPKAWPERLKTVWKVQVGTGHSSPVVVERRVYLLSRQAENEVASCFDLDTGKVLWRDAYPIAYEMNPAAVTHGKGPKSTPVLSGNRLYTLGITGVLSCYDAAAGKLRWRKDFAKQFKTTSPDFGTATSPMVWNGLVIAHVGGHDSGALTAFDAGTGEVKWSWNGDGPGYASPIIVEIDGTSQIVTQTQKSIAGFAAETGELLWQIPFETEYVQNIVTPVVYKQTLIFSGIDKGTVAVRAVRRANKWEPEQIWYNPDVSMYMSSPIVTGDYVFGFSHKRKGQFFCIDARTGKTLWTDAGRDGDNAAIVGAGQYLFLLTDGADLIIARNDPKQFGVVKKYSVAASPTWAYPAIVGNGVVIKDASTLALLSLE
jgi:outer membrane protein assembly factor BamB